MDIEPSGKAFTPGRLERSEDGPAVVHDVRRGSGVVFPVVACFGGRDEVAFAEMIGCFMHLGAARESGGGATSCSRDVLCAL